MPAGKMPDGNPWLGAMVCEGRGKDPGVLLKDPGVLLKDPGVL